MADKSKPGTKPARAPRKRVRKSAASKAAPNAAGQSQDKGGVGNTGRHHEFNKRVPEAALIHRPGKGEGEQGQKITTTPEVKGDKSLQIIDLTNGSAAIHVSLIEGKALNPNEDGRLVFIQGPVGNDLATVARARSLFAVKNDGTVVYNSRGFDDVPHADFDMVDIVKLIELNQKK